MKRVPQEDLPRPEGFPKISVPFVESQKIMSLNVTLSHRFEQGYGEST